MSNEGSEETNSLIEIETDFVIVATGFHADLGLLEQAGVAFIGDERIPCYNPETMETNVPGIFLAGTVISGGKRSYKDFIDTSHGHTLRIIKQITGVKMCLWEQSNPDDIPSNADIESTPLQNDLARPCNMLPRHDGVDVVNLKAEKASEPVQRKIPRVSSLLEHPFSKAGPHQRFQELA